MKTKLLLLSLFVAIVGNVWAQGPNNTGTYYQSANGKKGSELKTALCGVINPHIQRSYGDLWTDFQSTDARADGKVWDMYSNITNFTFLNDQDKGSHKSEGAAYNREHSFPKSWFNDEYPMYTDLFHLYPTDAKINENRGNLPFGEVGNSYSSSANKFSKWGDARSDLGYSGKVFEPNDEYKGDFARTYFYMVTCYETYYDGKSITSWNCEMLDGNKYPGLANWALVMLMKWAKNDPVSEKEKNRNNAVYGIQNNRNPFIDYPGLEDYIWGTLKDKAFSYDNYEGDSGGGEVPTIAMPVFSPDAGTYYNSVDVTLTCASEGASIYYTTNGADASVQSIPYEGPITLTETTTIKAVAVKDGETSSQASATYTITDQQGGGGETPINCEIALNNTLFGTNYSGTMNNVDEDLIGTKDGVTVIYAKGTGSNRYCNDSQIRIYPGNALTLSVGQGTITGLEFTMPESTTKVLKASTGSVSVDGTIMKWTGNTSGVDFSYDASSGHIKLSCVKVTVNVPSGPSAIDQVPTRDLSARRVIYNLRGQRVANPTRGIYIVDGKKVVVSE